MKIIICKFKEPFSNQDKDLIMSKGVIPGNSLIINRSIFISDWDSVDPQETCEFWNTELQDIVEDNILVEVIAI
jgi:hypothetical protein